jgi:hypothetical protein
MPARFGARHHRLPATAPHRTRQRLHPASPRRRLTCNVEQVTLLHSACSSYPSLVRSQHVTCRLFRFFDRCSKAVSCTLFCLYVKLPSPSAVLLISLFLDWTPGPTDSPCQPQQSASCNAIRAMRPAAVLLRSTRTSLRATPRFLKLCALSRPRRHAATASRCIGPVTPRARPPATSRAASPWPAAGPSLTARPITPRPSARRAPPARPAGPPEAPLVRANPTAATSGPTSNPIKPYLFMPGDCRARSSGTMSCWYQPHSGQGTGAIWVCTNSLNFCLSRPCAVRRASSLSARGGEVRAAERLADEFVGVLVFTLLATDGDARRAGDGDFNVADGGHG